jgi:hypothetical protein
VVRHGYICLLIGLLASARALAQAPASAHAGGVRLSWVRAEGAEACSDAAQLEAEVSRRLGRNPFQGPVQQVLEGLVRRGTDGTWTAELYDRDQAGQLSGSRQLTSQSADCAALASAVALAVALAIDPDAANQPADASENSQASADEKATQASPQTESPAPTLGSLALQNPHGPEALSGTDTSSPALRVKLGAMLAWQLVPGFAPGLDFAVDARLRGPLRLSLGVMYVPEEDTDKPRADFAFGLTAVHVGPCLMKAWERASVSGCAALSLGSLHAVVHEPRPLDAGDRVFASADLSAEGAIQLVGPVFMSASAGLTVPFVRPRFRVRGRSAVEFQQAPVSPVFFLGAGVRFP